MMNCGKNVATFCERNTRMCSVDGRTKNPVVLEQYKGAFDNYISDCNQFPPYGFFDINDEQRFLGGQNVHNLIIIALIFVVAMKVGALKKIVK